MSNEVGLADARATSVIVGTLFIVALVLHLIGGMIYGPATGSEEFLDQAYPDRTTVTLGVLIEFVAVMSIPLIGFFMFPVLKRFNEALALAYVGFRTVEAVFLIAIESKTLTLIDLSLDHQSDSESSGSELQAVGDALLAESDGIFELYVLVFTVGAMIFYAMLHHARLVPRWLAIWGFAAAAWMLVGTVLSMLDVLSGTSDAVQAVFIIPVPLNELALAAWLIFKGFDGRAALPKGPTEPRAAPTNAGQVS